MEALVELRALMTQKFPPYPPIETVCDVLSRFASKFLTIASIKGTGTGENDFQVIDLDSFQPSPLEVVAMCWTMFCDTGEPGVREFSDEAGLIREATLRGLNAICKVICPGPDSSKFQLVHFIMISQAIDHRIPEACQILAFKIIRQIFIQNEENREILTSFIPIIPPLIRLIRREEIPETLFMREWCAGVKAMLLRDDIRVAYNRSEERKRILFEEHTLRHLSRYLHDYTDEITLNSIVVLLGSMACHDNYCISMADGGILPALQKIFQSNPPNYKLCKNALSLFRFVCMSEEVRNKSTSYNLIKDVLNLARIFKDKGDIAEVAFSCTGFMTLRCKCNAHLFLQEGGAELSLDLAYYHMSRPNVLKGVCATLRNVASSSSKEGRKKILDHDCERVVIEMRTKYPELDASYAKPLLRDLGIPISPIVFEDESDRSSTSSAESDSYSSTLGSIKQSNALTIVMASANSKSGEKNGTTEDTLDLNQLPRIAEWSNKPYIPLEIGPPVPANRGRNMSRDENRKSSDWNSALSSSYDSAESSFSSESSGESFSSSSSSDDDATKINEGGQDKNQDQGQEKDQGNEITEKRKKSRSKSKDEGREGKTD